MSVASGNGGIHRCPAYLQARRVMEQLNLLTQDGFDAECEQAWEAYDSTCRATADEPHEHRFDGATFEPTKDGKRLNTQLYKVFSYMRDSKWYTLREVAQIGRAHV